MKVELCICVYIIYFSGTDITFGKDTALKLIGIQDVSLSSHEPRSLTIVQP